MKKRKVLAIVAFALFIVIAATLLPSPARVETLLATILQETIGTALATVTIVSLLILIVSAFALLL